VYLGFEMIANITSLRECHYDIPKEEKIYGSFGLWSR
jgi:hypothetical protein